MARSPVLGPCRSKKGLLFLRDCKEPAVDMCSICGRPICSIHSMNGPRGITCPECMAHQSQDERTAARKFASSSWSKGVRRYDLYRKYHYSPFYYGHHHFFSDDDYRTFDHYEMTKHKPRKTANAVTDANAIEDDFMES